MRIRKASTNPRPSPAGLCLGASGLFFIGLLVCTMAAAQGPDRPKAPPPNANLERKQEQKQARQRELAQHPHAPGFFQRLRELPPDEQERVMANDERFQRLPPARQAMIRRNLDHWNSLTPEQKERTRERQEILESLSPAQRMEARTIFPQYLRLPPERKEAVRQAFLHARDLPVGKREGFLSSPEVTGRFSPQELGVLRGLTQLLPGPGGKTGGDPGDEP
ncbi:MAG TPA: DUF3106 domain-containing protein [Terriglobia bacterium]|nr:DUF3106 domain-containing protein [Terriglobia bacterium]